MTTAATRYLVGASGDVPEGGRRVVDVAGTTIGVFRFKGALYAYENSCPHQGGPVCQGRLVPRVREVLDADKRSLGVEFDPDTLHIVCPWHGLEFGVASGAHPGKPQIRLRSFPVVEEEGNVYVSA
jgi:nitrite reductase/ring-hydroxylating ferredoxin subunit